MDQQRQQPRFTPAYRWEVMPGWERQVVQPIMDYNLAPREALSILQLVGQLVSKGTTVEHVIVALKTLLTALDDPIPTYEPTTDLAPEEEDQVETERPQHEPT